jgi:RHS repeat-associated protein
MGSFAYDSRNRLTSAGTTSYDYDAENKRISVTENGSKTSYVINPQSRLSQVLIKTDAQGNQTFYVYGLGLIGQEDASGMYLTYHFDRRGSTTALTDIGGAVTDRIQYAPYGELVSHTGSTSTPFMFNGQDGVMTDNNGLYYMRARYYNPEVKRFINRDVVQGSISNGSSLNRYAYVNGNPVSYVDPFGLSADSDTESPFNSLHTFLDIVGFIPVIGTPANALNAAIYLAEGDYVNAALSASAMIPFEGMIVKGAMLLKGAILFKGAGVAGFKAAALLGTKRIAKIEAKEILKGAGETTSLTKWGPEHAKGNILHNNAIENELNRAESQGASLIKKNKAQVDVYGNKVSNSRPDAATL